MKWVAAGVAVLVVVVGAFFLWLRPTYWAAVSFRTNKGCCATLYGHGHSPEDAMDDANVTVGEMFQNPASKGMRVTEPTHRIAEEDVPPGVLRSAQ